MIEMVGVLRESAGVANERVRRVERETWDREGAVEDLGTPS